MEEKMNATKVNIPDDNTEIDLSMLLQDTIRSFRRFWWLTVLLAAAFALIALVNGIRSYHPMYKAEATFTVETHSVNQSGYTFFYDNRTASQMALTFPYLLDSDLLLERVKADLEVEYLNGTPSATVVANSNLFTLSVTSRDPQDAYDILQALIKNYPSVAEYVIGKTRLNMIDYPEFPEEPYNSTQHLKKAAYGAGFGLVLGLGFVIVFAIFRNTVRKESDITNKLHTDCLGVVPMVAARGKRRIQDLSIHNHKVGSPFKESFRGLALQTLRVMENRKVLLITATTRDEGASTVARNLSQALTEHGKQVVLLDGTSQNPEQIAKLREEADYILIDTPACENLSKIAPYAEQADAVLYVVRQDHTKRPRIMNCLEDLNQFDAKLIGCVLSCVRSGAAGYGYGYGYDYGYGYGYGYGYHYGRYGGYGYGEEKGGKYAANKK